MSDECICSQLVRDELSVHWNSTKNTESLDAVEVDAIVAVEKCAE